MTTARPGELASRFVITKEDGSPVSIDDFPGRRLVAGEPGPELLTRSVDRVTGEAFWLLTKATLFEEDGRAYAVNIIEDVTHSKDAELRQRFLARPASCSPRRWTTSRRSSASRRSPCRGWRTGARSTFRTVSAASSRSRSRTPTRPRSRWRGTCAAASRPIRRPRSGCPRVLRGGPPELVRRDPGRVLEQAIDDPEQLARRSARSACARVMIVPMRIGEATLGALTFVTADSGRRFTDDDFAFAQDLALRAATAVQNARLYAEQARVAHTLQASLLPERLPELPGWGSAASYQAGEQGAEVGGDFYDIVRADRGRHLVFLGDVTGKGIAAAALTSLVRHSVRTAARFDPRPAAVLRLVNEILVEQSSLSPVTLVCALIDGSRMTVAAAGHPPPLLRRAGKVVELGPAGILLGAIGDRTFREETVEIRLGDTVLLYTDGVTDTPGAGDRFGPERLAAILTEAPEAPDAVLVRHRDGAARLPGGQRDRRSRDARPALHGRAGRGRRAAFRRLTLRSRQCRPHHPRREPGPAAISRSPSSPGAGSRRTRCG